MFAITLHVIILYWMSCFCSCVESTSDEEDELTGFSISGGQNATLEEFKFAGLVTSYYGKRRNACSGSLIRANFVLTAGHCLKNTPRTVTVSFRTNTDEMRTIKANRWHIHEKYREGQRGYDIGLIKLNRPATLIFGVDLAILPKTNELPSYGLEVIVIGYGNEKLEVYPPKKHLKKATMIVSNLCGDTHNCLSANSGSGSACVGDSGGPVIYKNTVIAVTAVLVNNKGSCDKVPAQFTTIFPFMKWINDKMEI